MDPEKPFDRSLEIVRELIRIDSVNPRLVPGGAGEARIAEFLCALLRGEGIDAQLQNVAPGRFNALAILKGGHPGPRILLNGHLDTVSVGGMELPFEPAQRDGKIFGRGSQDMKGGLAAAVSALLALSRHPDQFGGEIVLAAVADEEDLSLGTQFFLSHWPSDRPFELAVVLEPTDLKVCTAHKGFAWIEVTTRGVAAHGSRPQDGVDAIRAMGAILQELNLLDRFLQSHPAHPLLGAGSLHASLIEGGREWSSYPDQCTLKYERRTIPGESTSDIGNEIQSLLTKLKNSDPDFQAAYRLVCSRSPFEISRQRPTVYRFYQQALSQLPDLVGWGAVSFWTDAALLAEAHIPTVVFGPRGAGLHSLEEYVVASDIPACAKIIHDFVVGWVRGS